MIDDENSDAPADGGPADGGPADGDAAEQLGEGLRFLHIMGTQQQARTAELSASFYALLETMIAEGKIDIQGYEKRRQLTIVRENDRMEEQVGVHISPTLDKYALEELPTIDCAALLPICKGRCCMLPMVLSVQDLDERVIRWQYGRPYLIAQKTNGRCVHQSTEGACTVHASRPAACREYDCRSDPRIWKDFERRIPAD